MSYLGYDVNKDVSQQPVALNIMDNLQAGQNFSEGLLKQRQQQKVADLQNQYSNAPDDASRLGLLKQIAVYNPEHAKGMLAVSQSGINPFEGTSIEAQKANLQYQRYIAAGVAPGEAKLKAINDAASTSAQYYTDVGGNRVTVGGQPLPDVGALGGGQAQPNTGGTLTPPTNRTVTTAPIPSLQPESYTTAEMPANEAAPEIQNQAQLGAKAKTIADHAAEATPEEIQFAQDFASQPQPQQSAWYTQNAPAHPSLPQTLTPAIKEQLTKAADHFNNFQAPAGAPANSYANSPKVQVTGAEDQIKKAVELGNLQPQTAKTLEEDMIKSGAIGSQLSDIKKAMKPEYLTYGTQGNMAINAIKEKIDQGSITPEEKQKLTDYTEFRANAGQMFSNILKDLSGVAINPAEMTRAEKWIPSPASDSPTEFAAKSKRMMDFANKSLARQAYIRNNGFTIKLNSSIDRTLPLDSMPAIMNKRGDAIEKELAATGLKGSELKSAVHEKFVNEFGLVR